MQLNSVTKEELLVGAKHCIDNAQSLFKSGRSIGEKSNYGHGCSMLVLSIEEAVKCLVLIAKFFNVEVPDSAIKVFYDHKYKHGQGKEIQPLLSTIEWLSKNIKDLRKTSKILILDLGILFLFQGVLDKFLKENDKNKEWWISANSLKNAGLYVNYIDGSWRTPESVDPLIFARTLKIARSFVETLAVVKQIQPEDYKIISDN